LNYSANKQTNKQTNTQTQRQTAVKTEPRRCGSASYNGLQHDIITSADQ